MNGRHCWFKTTQLVHKVWQWAVLMSDFRPLAAMRSTKRTNCPFVTDVRLHVPLTNCWTVEYEYVTQGPLLHCLVVHNYAVLHNYDTQQCKQAVAMLCAATTARQGHTVIVEATDQLYGICLSPDQLLIP